MDGAGTSIDKLYLDIGVNAKGTTRTINSIYKSLDKLTSSISAFDAKGLHKKFDSLFRILNNTDATGFANLTKNLSGVANAFSKITNASKIDTKGLYAKFNSLTRIITPFVDKVKEGETSLVALSQTLKSMKSPTSTGGGKTSNGGTNRNKKDNVNIFATLGKWNYMINMARYYGRSLANIVQLSMDYVETQNLWQVANRNNLEMAEQFIQKMNKAYGVSEAALMNYQAIFKNMLSALGDLSDEISSGLSMQLTQMALDFSSLYNVTIPSAMQKFQAVLSGQVRPIRSVSGYDITENTIFDLYAGAGGEKTMRQLSQIEKRLLRIVAVFDQMGATGATGDMAKTIESASNQARIMNEQFKETMTWTGQIVLMWLDSAGVFQKINAFLITMKEIMRAIAYDLGYSEQNFLDGLVTSAEDAGEAVDDIQGKLLSFDKFEALNSNQSNVLGIDQTVLDLLEKINYQTEEFEMEATKISDQWLTALGFIDENGDGILEITDKARKLLDTLKIIGTIVGSLIGASLLTKLLNITGIVQTFSGVLKIIPSLLTAISAHPIVAVIVAISAVLVYMYNTNEKFRESVNKLFKSLGEVLGVVFEVLEPIFDIVSELIDMLAPALSWIAEKLAVVFNWLAEHKTVLAFMINPIVGIIYALKTYGEEIKNFFVGIWKAIANGFANMINGIANGFANLINGICNSFIGFVNFLIDGLNIIIKPIDEIAGIFGGNVEIPHWDASVNWQPNVNWQPYPSYATGGFPEDGLFFANSGELVGQFSNGKTAVANNDQITKGIAMAVEPAVYRAVKSAMATGNGGDIVLKLDGKELARANVGNNARALSSNYRIELQPR